MSTSDPTVVDLRFRRLTHPEVKKVLVYVDSDTDVLTFPNAKFYPMYTDCPQPDRADHLEGVSYDFSRPCPCETSLTKAQLLDPDTKNLIVSYHCVHGCVSRRMAAGWYPSWPILTDEDYKRFRHFVGLERVLVKDGEFRFDKKTMPHLKYLRCPELSMSQINGSSLETINVKKLVIDCVPDAPLLTSVTTERLCFSEHVLDGQPMVFKGVKVVNMPAVMLTSLVFPDLVELTTSFDADDGVRLNPLFEYNRPTVLHVDWYTMMYPELDAIKGLIIPTSVREIHFYGITPYNRMVSGILGADPHLFADYTLRYADSEQLAAQRLTVYIHCGSDVAFTEQSHQNIEIVRD